ncbi:MAG TPA: peptidoglycan DD-metalloendopeptidase family protein [Chitinophagales bacterium]|nr:peptidoglycan DD-metalloendopeptidase family protein [Chitinophagales bacterium]
MKTALTLLLFLFPALFYNSAKRAGGALPANGEEKNEPAVYPQNYFRAPLNLPLTLAGNFGEPRSGHFHTGLDFCTNEEEGHVVLAAADGYISRINISPYGYGNALYIQHPNGYTTVYGHLQKFSPAIQERTRKEQYAKKSFSIDLFPAVGELPVKKGDTIAWSGNTGSSGGPHLHFEIRDAREHPINPCLFGFDIKDSLPPVVSYLKFYPLDGLKYKSDGYITRLIKKGNRYGVAGDVVKVNDDKAGVAVNAYDIMQGVSNYTGIYDLKLFDNGQKIYEYQINSIAFTETRFVLSQVDFPLFRKYNYKPFQRCYLQPGNRCPVYKDVVNSGMIDLSDKKEHAISIEVADYNGNTDTIKFGLQYDANSGLFKEEPVKYVQRFDYEKENKFSNEDVSITAPKYCLFDTLYFNYSASPAVPGLYSKVHQVGDNSTELLSWFDISIKAVNLPPRLRDKALVCRKGETGGDVAYGGSYSNGYVLARARAFGAFYIKTDTLPPRIIPVNITPGKNMAAAKRILFKIEDDLSGIAAFNTYIDGEWALTAYAAKTDLLIHDLDPALKPGTHTFKVVVTDERGNTATYSIKFRV